MEQEPHPRGRVALTIGLLVVLVVHVGLRAWGLFGPPSLRPLIIGSFLLLWPTPWVLLRADERQAIGFGRARASKWWPIAIFGGVGAALGCFALAWLLFGATPDNPFISVQASFLSGGAPPVSRFLLFLIFTGPALIFSPFGEEVFCRGVISGRVVSWWSGPATGAVAGVVTSATVFASIHLLHHGLVVSDGVVSMRALSGAVWFVMMFVTSVMFSSVRRAGGSIWLAIVSHAAFNLAMNAAIFSVFP